MKPSRWAAYAESSDAVTAFIFREACSRGQSAYYEWLLTPVWNIPRRLYLRSVCRRCQVLQIEYRHHISLTPSPLHTAGPIIDATELYRL